jgi:hypothetical protein
MNSVRRGHSMFSQAVRFSHKIWGHSATNFRNVFKAGDTLSSRHVSSCDVNACSWDVRGDLALNVWRRFTLLSLCLRHVISRGALVVSRASTPLKFLMSHTFRETLRTCRALFRRYHLFSRSGGNAY